MSQSRPGPPDPVQTGGSALLLGDVGSAGGSAAHRAHHDQDAGQHLDPGQPLAELVPVLASTGDPAAQRWERGALGERATARILAPLAAVGVVVLHDRRIPGTTANIDHLVISRHTVHVIDSKAYRGRVFIDAHGALRLGSVPLQEKVDRARWMTEEVESRVNLHLVSGSMTVRGALCIHDARIPRSVFRWDGIDIVQPHELLRLLAIDVSGSPGPATGVVGGIVQAFPPALANHSSTQELS